jgi:hypothetical protein
MKMLTYARQNSIPVWTELNLLDFIKMKDEATFRFKWSGNQLTFKLTSKLKHKSDFTFILPINHDNLKIKQIDVNGCPGR